MSVLVKELTVIVRRSALDEHYDGGTTAYLRAAADPTVGAHFVCADEHLTAVSFLDYERAFEFTDVGVIGPALEICYFDERMGPSSESQWLDWRREREGYVHCWLAGTAPGTLASPAGWAPGGCAGARPASRVGEGGSMMRLAVEQGTEYWLDLATGRQVVRPPPLVPPPETPPPAAGATLKQTVEAALRALEWRWTERTPTVLALHINGACAVYQMMIAIDETMAQVICYCCLPVRIPADRRAATAELFMRASYPLTLGTFELDFDDGEARFKLGIDVEQGTLAPRMVQNMIAMACAAWDRVHPAVMAVAFGGVAPVEAIQEL